MKSPAQLDREIKAVADFVNSFDSYDPTNREQFIACLVHEALLWASGVDLMRPSDRLRDLAKEWA